MEKRNAGHNIVPPGGVKVVANHGISNYNPIIH